MRDSVPSARYSSVCNVLRQWNSSLIPTYRVYRLYVSYLLSENVLLFLVTFLNTVTYLFLCLGSTNDQGLLTLSLQGSAGLFSSLHFKLFGETSSITSGEDLGGWAIFRSDINNYVNVI